MTHPIEQWHALVTGGNPAEGLDALLDDNCTFWSPVVHTPQEGKMLTTMYLMGAVAVFKSTPFTYVREVIGETDAVLEFVTEVDGITFNGVDMIRWDPSSGKIVDFKVMLRPLKAVNMMHKKMGEMLAAMKKPE